jgi:hypothetical protein
MRQRARTEKVVEFFLEREAAEAMIREVREEESVLAEELRVEASRFSDRADPEPVLDR